MDVFTKVDVLKYAINAAQAPCLRHLEEEYQKLQQGACSEVYPLVVVEGERTLQLPMVGRTPVLEVVAPWYAQRFVSTFNWMPGSFLQPDKNWYGIAKYRRTSAGRWECEELHLGNVGIATRIHGYDEAQALAKTVARRNDASIARVNEDIILRFHLLEEAVLYPLIVSLVAHPGKLSACVRYRNSRLKLVHADESENSEQLCSPVDGFVCRDAAAHYVLRTLICAFNRSTDTVRGLSAQMVSALFDS